MRYASPLRTLGLLWSHQELNLGLRRLSTGPPDPSLIILNPRQAGLVKSKPRRPNRRSSPTDKKIETIPFVTPLDLPSDSDVKPEPIVSAIHSLRPETAKITKQRFEKIRDDLTRGFRKAHLKDYLIAQKVHPSVYNKLTKDKLADYIMSGVWNCAVRADGQSEGTSVFVENIIELPDQDFVLTLGGNGRLLRDWSKSGARIAVSPARCQIIVNSTQETFDWINASLSHFLESVTTAEIDLVELKTLVDNEWFPRHLRAIQQLTDTYFKVRGDKDSESILVFSAGSSRRSNIGAVKRMLVQLTQPAINAKWKPASWWFDTNMESQTQSSFAPFDDLDAMEWTERMRQWSRWEKVKTKNDSRAGLTSAPAAHQLAPLVNPEFSDSASETYEGELSDQLEKVFAQLLEQHPAPLASVTGETVSSTVTVTPGLILQENDSSAVVPNAGMAKTFNTNAPFVTNLASTLPLFNKDVKQEDVVDAPTPNTGAPSWSELLNQMDSSVDEDGAKVFVNRRKELDLPSNARLVQMKFVANPHNGSATRYPPLEAWVELPPMTASDRYSLEVVPRLVAVPVEASSYVSLPNRKADLKLTLAHTYPVKITDEVESYFLKECSFGREGPLEIPPGFNVELNGEIVSYLYHSAAYVTLADLDFQGNLLQFSQVEGGKLGGRKIEANIVEHGEDANEFDAKEAARRAVKTALEFTSVM